MQLSDSSIMPFVNSGKKRANMYAVKSVPKCSGSETRGGILEKKKLRKQFAMSLPTEGFLFDMSDLSPSDPFFNLARQLSGSPQSSPTPSPGSAKKKKWRE